jgi:hypothetical protein
MIFIAGVIILVLMFLISLCLMAFSEMRYSLYHTKNGVFISHGFHRAVYLIFDD